MTVLIGTSGFSYKDWMGPVYPADLPKQERLSFYASEFKTCELNFSYYRIPSARTLAAMSAKVGEGFQFPHSFHANPANRDYLKRVREGFGDLPVAVATGPVAYVRFHGRNYEKWWKESIKTCYPGCRGYGLPSHHLPL